MCSSRQESAPELVEGVAGGFASPAGAIAAEVGGDHLRGDEAEQERIGRVLLDERLELLPGLLQGGGAGVISASVVSVMGWWVSSNSPER